MVHEIALTRGKVALVDDEDYEALSRFKWHTKRNRNHTFYAARSIKVRKDGRPTVVTIRMHRQILQANDCHLVDHWDGNGLNNRRSNLRIATAQQNAANRRKPSAANSTSCFKGVRKNRNTWEAMITVEGRTVIRRCSDPLEAALLYDEMAIQAHGEFACINFPISRERSAR